MSMRTWIAIAAIGRDRPGIVADLSECVYECGCNLEDTSMTMLGSEFAVLMLVSGHGDDVRERLYDATKRLEWERRLTVFLRPVDPPAETEEELGVEYSLSAVGVDKAGIVAGVSRCLAESAVPITDLRGEVSFVPQSGTPLYTLAIRMRIPPGTDKRALERKLEEVAVHLGIEVTLSRL